MADRESKRSPEALDCLGGAEPTPEITLGLKDLLLLPESAKRQLWEILGPVVQHPLPEDLDTRLDAFRRKHEVPPGRFARALAACRGLLRGAGQHDCTREAFEADLARLSDPKGEISAILMPGFDTALEAIKREILYRSLVDHGKLLVGVDWRVDSMLHSNRGRQLSSPVTQVTLRYLEGKQECRVTVQALPDLLRELQTMCNQILG